MNKENLSLVLASAAILLWASVAAIAKIALQNINSVQLLFYVSLFSVSTLFLVVLFTKRTKQLKSLTSIDLVKHFIPVGTLGTFLYTAFYFAAIAKALAAEAMIISWLNPIFIILFSVLLLKEKLSLRIGVATLLCFSGAVVVITKGNILGFKLTNLYGDIFAFGSAISWALFSVLSKKRKFDSVVSMFLYSVFGFAFAMLSAFLTKNITFIQKNEFIGAFYIGVLPTAIAFTMWIKSLEIGDVHKIANLTYLTPFVSLIFISLLTNERIFLSQIVGLSIIVSGILFHKNALLPESAE